ncbi:MAG: InlB B-repeat-containing protein [Bacillales bacterium]|jgi:uncharacterized repeat protein (TIGR02543 family)|nr:InlB B-repeat-containing protein [Bacillales bacterium]
MLRGGALFYKIGILILSSFTLVSCLNLTSSNSVPEINNSQTSEKSSSNGFSDKSSDFESSLDSSSNDVISSSSSSSSSSSTINRYTVSFYDGEQLLASNTYDDGYSLNNVTSPEKDGYTFLRWYTNAELSQTAFFPIVVHSDLNFYAKWNIISYSIIYYVNGGIELENATYNAETPTITLPIPIKTGYTFMGWYESNFFSGSAITQIPKGSTGDKTYYAKWEITTYSVTFYLNGGTGVIDFGYNYESETIVLNEPTRTGYTFIGWHENNDFSGSIVTQIPHNSTGNKAFYAKWEAIVYTITFVLNGGSGVSDSTYIIESETITLPTPIRTGYDFLGWYESSDFDGSIIIEIPKGSVGDKTYYAKWNIVTYIITYHLNGGTGVSDRTYTIETNTFTLPTPTKTGYAFMGWYESSDFSGSIITEISIGSINNKEFYARWSDPITYTITYNLNGGAGATNTTYNVETETITLPTPTRDVAVFAGWYENNSFNGSVITEIPQGSTGNKTFYAKWEIIFGIIFQEINEYDLTYHYMYFGRFPQTVVDDATTIATLNAITETNDNDYYEYDGEQYAKLNATSYETGYKFNNGTTITSGTTYYFKVEPIKWRVLSSSNGEYQILSEYLLTNKRFDDDSNIYADSEIRQYLINTFYNQSFSSMEKDTIQTTILSDLSIEDKVYLLSRDDYQNTSYGFSSSTGFTNTRYAIVTDYAKANGAHSLESSPYNGTGYYWIRRIYYPNQVQTLNYRGSLSSSDVYISYLGVRPAITIKP